MRQFFPSSFLRLFLALVLGFAAPAAPAARAQEATAPPDYPFDARLFPMPEELVPNYHFWIDIFTRHDSNTVVLHDEDHVEIVYAVLDFSELAASDLSVGRQGLRRRKAVQEAEQHARSMLLALASGRDLEDADTQRNLEAQFSSLPGGRSKYRAAAARLRTQTGLQDVFEAAIGRAGRYMGAMEASFRRQGVPVELTRMPFVESMFQTRARSKVGAGGIWQMMPNTARAYVKVGMEIDERYDPLLATDGAAVILKENFDDLQSWPLAITAYNYGKYGMLRAVRKLETRDLGVIVRNHQSRIFGFASKNFYAEVMAAATVYHHRERYFPGAVSEPALEFEEMVPQLYVSAPQWAKGAEVDLDKVTALNPALAPQVWDGDLLIPRGYRLRVPHGTKDRFEAAYTALPDGDKQSRQAGFRYKVRRGDTLSVIAARHGTSVTAIQRANALRSAHSIRAGQSLLIPPGRGGNPRRTNTATVATTAPPADGVHVVRSGDTLSTLAQRYGTSIDALIAANRLKSSHRIFIGQRLQIPTGPGTRHVVRSGETLAAIAGLYKSTVAAIQKANALTGHLIYPRQVLIIP